MMYNRNMFYEVIPEGKVEALTYSYRGEDDDAGGDSLLPGQIVVVPLGRRVVPGVVVKKVAQPDFKTKAISKVLYSKPLPPHLLKTVQFMHEYYLVPSGQALSVVLPRGVQKQRRKGKTEQMFGCSFSGVGDPHAPSRGASTTPVATGVVALPLALPGSGPPSMKVFPSSPSTNLNLTYALGSVTV